MTAFEHIHMPSLAGATGWLNSEPLDSARLRGRVVLIDFWTLTCINWLRTEPYLRGWWADRDDGLVVSAFANHYWPALYFVDADGIIRDITSARDATSSPSA